MSFAIKQDETREQTIQEKYGWPQGLDHEMGKMWCFQAEATGAFAFLVVFCRGR